MENSPTTASCGNLMMMGSYGGVHHHHQHQHHTNNVSSMDPNHTQMMSTIHPYHFLQQNDNPNHTTATLPPLPSPLGGVSSVAVVGCDGGSGSGSGSGAGSNNNQFMMWDNYYQSKQQQQQQLPQHHHFVNINNDTATPPGDTCSTIKAKIMAHPHYPRLLTAYVNCQKVGAPPEVVGRLEEACSAAVGCLRRGSSSGGVTGMSAEVGEDPSLDQFMEAYCEMLSKYEQELTKPFKEAMVFLSRIESQFKSLSLSSSSSADSSTAFGEANDRNGSSEEEIDVNASAVDPLAEDRELKFQLLRKYSGYLGSLKQEFMKKRKKGKLPKEARQQLLEWWTRHYKWPYPSESQKLALAEATGLDQKQINNWFINQRKRHWKPSEDMQFVVMDATASHHQHHPHYYMDNVLGNPYPMDISSALL